MFTDPKRLQQIIKNLLANAFKFTQQGRVSLSVQTAHEGWTSENESLNRAQQVIVFEVTDTGIGIAPDKQQIIFEAFQQADGSTSRKYGGTGLGLAISRELSRLLGGEIRLSSQPGVGSTFSLFIPQSYNFARAAKGNWERFSCDAREKDCIDPRPCDQTTRSQIDDRGQHLRSSFSCPSR